MRASLGEGVSTSPNAKGIGRCLEGNFTGPRKLAAVCVGIVGVRDPPEGSGVVAANSGPSKSRPEDAMEVPSEESSESISSDGMISPKPVEETSVKAWELAVDVVSLVLPTRLSSSISTWSSLLSSGAVVEPPCSMSSSVPDSGSRKLNGPGDTCSLFIRRNSSKSCAFNVTAFVLSAAAGAGCRC